MTFRYVVKPPEEVLPERIQGRRASDLEARVAIALYKLDVDFKFQVDILYGRKLAGGLVLDFLVLLPLPLPIMVQGEYWHRGEEKAQDAYNSARLLTAFKGLVAPAVELFGQDLQTQEDADRVVREAVRGF